ncbi:Eco57I restriction-modification methylase domain-containing protein [Oleispirillum naphthae]|uniref:Eco57I restriction-modification methylase domain-containing protein n=1 Tax=Oleispirillum naphthae TaxID=2838853 RepID=UPI00308245AB
MDHGKLEAQRLVLQAELDAQKSQVERNKLGQFATPTALAREILSASLGLLPPDETIRFLDPAIGTGAFFSALLATASHARIAKAVGYEVDAHYGSPAIELWRGTGLDYRMGDFTTQEPGERANLVICNPPYVRHHHMTKEKKISLQDASEHTFGVRVAGLAGLYTYFLALSHAWMAENGIAAWLVPSEFMDVNYGRAVKKYLLGKVTLLRIHRFEPHDAQFNDALVSSSVIWFRNAPPPPTHHVEFTFGGTLADARVRKMIADTDLADEPKWTHYPVSGVRIQRSGARIGDFFKIHRGIATGDNKFFLLTAEQASARGIPAQFLRPILPSPRYLKDSEIPAETDGTPKIEKPLFLLDCRLPPEEVAARHPALWAYLSSGIPRVSNRYLCAHRSPWYRQENRPPAPILCTYMGRSGGKNGKAPFQMILNHSKAIAANVYLMLYPKPSLQSAIDERPELLHKVWQFLQTVRLEEMLDEGRVYGGGLHKMEPKELANVGAGEIAELISLGKPQRRSLSAAE